MSEVSGDSNLGEETEQKSEFSEMREQKSEFTETPEQISPENKIYDFMLLVDRTMTCLNDLNISDFSSYTDIQLEEMTESIFRRTDDRRCFQELYQYLELEKDYRKVDIFNKLKLTFKKLVAENKDALHYWVETPDNEKLYARMFEGIYSVKSSLDPDRHHFIKITTTDKFDTLNMV